jgi:hypothetical protein
VHQLFQIDLEHIFNKESINTANRLMRIIGSLIDEVKQNPDKTLSLKKTKNSYLNSSKWQVSNIIYFGPSTVDIYSIELSLFDVFDWLCLIVYSSMCCNFKGKAAFTV